MAMMEAEKNFKEMLLKGSLELGLDLSLNQINSFYQYFEYLVGENKKYNLTSIVDMEGVVVKHFLDSLTCSKTASFLGKKVVDMGTGAGFPGMPLKIVFPDIKLTLVDSNNKKVQFVKSLGNLLEIKELQCIQARAEDAGRVDELREAFDIALSRAVAPLNILAEYCLPLVKPGGVFISMKGPQAVQEMEQAATAIKAMGGGGVELKVLKLPLIYDSRSLVIIQKISSTPHIYPRKTGLPSKKPIQ